MLGIIKYTLFKKMTQVLSVTLANIIFALIFDSAVFAFTFMRTIMAAMQAKRLHMDNSLSIQLCRDGMYVPLMFHLKRLNDYSKG